MCRSRQQIIQDEVEVQKLINIKEKLENGEINGFNDGRLLMELTKIESQIESIIREFMQSDRQQEQQEAISELRGDMQTGFEKHYQFHKKNPSLVALFKRSPTGFLSVGGAGLVASSLFYVKETRDVIFSLVGLEAVAGQELLNYGFPLFIVLLLGGIVAFTQAKEKPINGEEE